MFIDIHTHVQQFIENDLDLLINNSINSKIEIIIAAGTTISDSKKTIELSKKYELIYSAVGIHPQNIFDENTNDYINILEGLLSNNKTIMISEIGLDIQPDSPDINIQKEFFSNQIGLARDFNLPIAFHVRNAEKEAIDLLETENIKDLISVAHYFLGDYEYAKRLLDNNIYISVAKPFLRDNNLAEVISKLPLDKLVIETDSYPQYFKKNRMRWTEPKDLIIIVKKLSEIFNKNEDEVREIILCNSKKILKV